MTFLLNFVIFLFHSFSLVSSSLLTLFYLSSLPLFKFIHEPQSKLIKQALGNMRGIQYSHTKKFLGLGGAAVDWWWSVVSAVVC